MEMFGTKTLKTRDPDDKSMQGLTKHPLLGFYNFSVLNINIPVRSDLRVSKNIHAVFKNLHWMTQKVLRTTGCLFAINFNFSPKHYSRYSYY